MTGLCSLEFILLLTLILRNRRMMTKMMPPDLKNLMIAPTLVPTVTLTAKMRKTKRRKLK